GSAVGGRVRDEGLQLAFEPGVSDDPFLEGEADPRRRRSCGRAELRRGSLREPEDARVPAEVVVAKLRVAVEPEREHDAPLERADEEVSEEVRPRLLDKRLADLVEREYVVAGVAAQARDPSAGDDLVERAACAAVGERDGELRVEAAETRELTFDAR